MEPGRCSKVIGLDGVSQTAIRYSNEAPSRVRTELDPLIALFRRKRLKGGDRMNYGFHELCKEKVHVFLLTIK
jgi:hypothetical protein